MAVNAETEIHLQRDHTEAIVTTTGAALRSLSVEGEPILWGSAAGEICRDGRGQVLAPWPNRLEDGQYSFGGRSAQAAWDEPSRRNAIHGLVRWLTWIVEERTEERVRLACPLAPQPAYPFYLGLSITYELPAAGLSVRVTARNEGNEPLPFGIGFHPYLLPGSGGLDGASLLVPAGERLSLDGRGLPTGREELSTKPAWPSLKGVQLDDCFTALACDGDGLWRTRFRPGGTAERVVTVTADAVFAYVMCYTADTLDPPHRRSGLAIEPMTCPPNALRSGEGIIALVPGEDFSASWGISVSPA